MSSPPVPKPRYSRSFASVDMNFYDGNLKRSLSNGHRASSDKETAPTSAPADSKQSNFPTLTDMTDIITANIPCLAGAAATFASPAPSASSAPPSVDSLVDRITSSIPGLAEASVKPDAASSASFTSAGTVSAAPDIINTFSALNDLLGLAQVDAIKANPSAPPLAPESHLQEKQAKPEDDRTGVAALSQLVKGLNPSSGANFPSAEPINEVKSHPPFPIKEENLYVTVLAPWNGQNGGSESSNEEEDTVSDPIPTGSSGGTDQNSGSEPVPNRTSSSESGPLTPCRPAPPPPVKKPVKQKTPRAATIRVSRKKERTEKPTPQSAVVRASWLDVWKGFRHSVLWVTLDGQLMSLRRKRSDRFSEVLFHVSSITNVKPQEKGHFSIYFRKKHYDFMAHNEEVRESWLSSLLATRGVQSPAPPELHGQVTLKDTRSRAYAAVWGHDLWIYSNKENFQLGLASFSVPLNVATVKPIGKHSFTVITPYKTFNLSVDSNRDLPIWMDRLSSTISNALSCSQVALRLWENPFNKVCADCGAANPEWASVNLLLVICHNCAGQHRALGSNLSKVRSLRMDNKAWTEPLMQLFVAYGNRLANQVWASAIPASEQLRPESTDEERSKFIQDKYSRGRYRRVHALTSSRSMMNQRLCQVVLTDDVEETMSLICSGAKVSSSDPQSPSPILLAEKANQALQIELLRLNEYTEVPPHQPKSARTLVSTSSAEDEELHGKLEDDRFLFSLENDSAACDVLDLREVVSVFLSEGPEHQFTLVTLNDQMVCDSDDRETLQNHLVHILKVILPGGVSYAEVGGASAVSKVCMVEVGGTPVQSDSWLLLWEDGVSIHPINKSAPVVSFDLSMLSHHDMEPSENIITMVTDRSYSLCFEDELCCQTWYSHLQRAVANQDSASAQHPVAKKTPVRSSLYPVLDAGLKGSVPPAIERCISHITTYGLKVEGIYRRCGLASKVKHLVEVLITSPNSAPLEGHEQGVLDAGSALKQYIRDHQTLIPDAEREQWLKAAVVSDEGSRFKAYRRLLRQLPGDCKATLNALFGHFYMVQVFSQVNKMSAHNLAVVLVPSLFQSMNQDLIGLTKEFIIHHTLLFLTPESKSKKEEEEQITAL